MSRDVRYWHKADIVDVRFFGRYQGQNRRGRKARKCRLVTQSGPNILRGIAAARDPKGTFQPSI
jgi:hypothetical protein